MNEQFFTTKADALGMIEDAIGSDAYEFDLDAVVAETFTWDGGRQGFAQTATTDEFWAAVERHVLTEFTVEVVNVDSEADGISILGWNDEEVDGDSGIFAQDVDEWNRIATGRLKASGWIVAETNAEGTPTKVRRA